jgi:hypothetical protein
MYVTTYFRIPAAPGRGTRTKELILRLLFASFSLFKIKAEACSNHRGRCAVLVVFCHDASCIVRVWFNV